MLQWLGTQVQQLTSGYEVHKQIGSGGAGLQWKVFSATSRTNSQPVSLFTFDTSSTNAKQSADVLKKDCSTLARLRHPNILEVKAAASETSNSNSLSFAAEPLVANLANVLGNLNGFDHTSPAKFKDEFKLDENGWTHVALSPEAIFINAKGDWKLALFSFAQHSTSSPTATSPFYLSNYPPFCSPSLDFLAPETVLDSSCSTASDLWSLGCLIYSLYNYGHSPISCAGNVNSYKSRMMSALDSLFSNSNNLPQGLEAGNIGKCTQNVGREVKDEFEKKGHNKSESDADIHLESVEGGLKTYAMTKSQTAPHLTWEFIDLVRGLLKQSPQQRLSLASFQSSPYFDNLLVSTITFLETIVEKNQVTKAQFFKGLVQILPQYSMKTVNRKILPALLGELKDPLMSPFILPCLFWISENSSEQEFTTGILPSLKPIFQLNEPPQALLLLLSRMDIFMKKLRLLMYSNAVHVMPLLYTSLTTPHPQIQEQAIKTIPILLPNLDFSTVKSSLFPKLAHIYQTSTTLSIRVACLITLHAMLKLLDKFTVRLVALLVVWEEVAKVVEKEVVAGVVLGECWKMAVDPCLNVKQFRRFMKVIREIGEKVEEAQVKFLEERKGVMEVSPEVSGLKISGAGGSGSGASRSEGVSQAPDFASLVRGSTRPSAAAAATALSSSADVNGFADFAPFSQTSQPTSQHRQSNEWAAFNQPSQSSISTNAVPIQQPLQPTSNASFANWNSQPQHQTSSYGGVFGASTPSTVIPTLAPPPMFASTPLQPSGGVTLFSAAPPPGWGTQQPVMMGQKFMTPMVGQQQFSGQQQSSAQASKRSNKMNEFDPFG
ncbi:kinase-like protein [Rhizoclosmatium globosum]|uniref:Kinase-like protein n=1 Tax=Rhizoclosmatium globosum TaxID=329046 RepID=A0A1Y2CDY5_9FUNG|nr:kinase-like protein [Rhizoclosmatium globosum]|eukprot:ORY45271.1 kinase-like protein [Rhizoclosmatium globosum]